MKQGFLISCIDYADTSLSNSREGRLNSNTHQFWKVLDRPSICTFLASGITMNYNKFFLSGPLH